ncbi:hypothetical protein CUJ83_13740 [Methanocella sp. CWC-04]|uniref:Archaeal Type IV pilin N-terminal domain-containing protein n=1 Tax=Methanooceanicella nereidis TaxID=2052831 RepID=A0AAP2RFY6_9EURY|nr:type IV pilin N-terminal domain-containing protein [Methanocella sp. CWC-04]MCD1296061.1 hypothetical protein [Methanocella sp. CWC-04]
MRTKRNNASMLSSESAVSELVGELLILLITVAIFTILIAATYSFFSRPQSHIVSTSVEINDTSVIVMHSGGDSVPLGDIDVMINGAAYNLSRPGSFVSHNDGNVLWDIGEAMVFPFDTGQNLSVFVYDRASRSSLGHFMINNAGV